MLQWFYTKSYAPKLPSSQALEHTKLPGEMVWFYRYWLTFHETMGYKEERQLDLYLILNRTLSGGLRYKKTILFFWEFYQILNPIRGINNKLGK